MLFTDYYNDIASSKNNLSYWFPRIKDCGIKVPDTQIFKVPEDIMKAFYLEWEEYKTQEYCMDKIYTWVKDEVYPNLTIKGLLFMKNGAFSNKFQFNNCTPYNNPLSITASLIDLEYASLMFETGGNAELIFRERIPHNSNIIPHIYGGMPLQPEYRVFYDFDNHKALYVVNYWDYDYCHDSICDDSTDRLIYESYYPTILEQYNKHKDTVMDIVNTAMSNNTLLNGIWSIDILQDETGEYWLIDMAEAYWSAYWDPKKAGL